MISAAPGADRYRCTVSGWDDVRSIAEALPGTVGGEQRGLVAWRVADKLFAWERPLRPGDLEALLDDAPTGPVLGVRVADLGEKDALLATVDACFTTPHFDGYRAVLVDLDAISRVDLEPIVIESWLVSAPKRIARAYLGEH
jgi:hypothetical protein